MLRFIVILMTSTILALTLGGCGTSRSPTPKEVVIKDLAEGRWEAAYDHGIFSLTPRDQEFAKELKEKYPNFENDLVAVFLRKAETVSTTQALEQVRLAAIRIHNQGEATEAKVQPIHDMVRRRVNAGEFNLENFPELALLQDDASKARMGETAQSKVENGDKEYLNTAAKFLDTKNANAKERARFTEAVLRLRLNPSELSASALDEATKRKYEAAYRKDINIKSNDRLVEVDLSDLINQGNGWVRAVPSAKEEIAVNKLQWDVSQRGPTTQVVTYATHQVNLLGAVLLMPKNASYAFDYTFSAASVEYAFEIKYGSNNAIVRDRRTAETGVCSNARIINVFGGIQPASFVANDHMANLCNNNRGTLDANSVRRDVLRTIRDRIVAMMGK